MESIQLAQMLADLSDLNAAVSRDSTASIPTVLKATVPDNSPQQESQAALALVNASKTLNTTSPPTDSSKPSEQLHPPRPGPRNHHRSGSAGSGVSTGSSFISRTASPAKFDKFGRRILTPPNTRTNSAYGSIPGTPRREAEADDDVDRANTLMALYDIRAKLKDQDSSRNLSKLREKIAALHAKQAQAEKKDGTAGSRFTYPKTA